jgi:AAHS family 4-hydroxybenzoate transporter-like MFS transporter
MSSVEDEINVDRVLDAARFAGLPVIVLGCAMLVLVLDGFDLQIIGFAAPLLATDFHVERSELAPVLAASLFGMAIGSFGIGPVGDRWGRRPALLGSVALFGLTTLLGATSANLWTLAFWRFLTGIGLGGALPNATALMAEFAPPRWRSQAIALAIVGVPIGGMLGSALAAEVLVTYGWRTLFVIGGALPLLVALVMHFVMPESPRYLATRGHRRGELAALLNRITGAETYGANHHYVTDYVPASSSRVSILFSRELWRDTLATWLIFASNSIAIYAFFSWSPVVLTSLGFDLATAVRGSFYFNLAGIIGALANAPLIARIGSRAPVALMAAIAAIALFVLGWISPAAVDVSAAPPVVWLMAGIAFAGLGVNAVQIGMYAVSAHIYPTVCRSSGVGWALGAGRLGGILSAFFGGALFAQSGGRGFFVGVGCALIVAFVGIVMIRRHIPPSAHSS